MNRANTKNMDQLYLAIYPSIQTVFYSLHADTTYTADEYMNMYV